MSEPGRFLNTGNQSAPRPTWLLTVARRLLLLSMVLVGAFALYAWPTMGWQPNGDMQSLAGGLHASIVAGARFSLPLTYDDAEQASAFAVVYVGLLAAALMASHRGRLLPFLILTGCAVLLTAAAFRFPAAAIIAFIAHLQPSSRKHLQETRAARAAPNDA